jgi:BirA family biotin operon repressor/biotin-[acetyl-CoA-carboxylase] ligase
VSTLDASAVLEGLATRALGRPLHVHGDVGSTNDLALDLMQSCAVHGATVVADRQTAGRGQRGRAWHSPAGVGLYISVVLRGSRRLDAPTLVVAAVGLGLAEGLERVTGARVEIKWPNDLWCRGRKLAGILVESRGFSPERPSFVAGMGINVNHSETDFPPDVREIATSLALRTGRRHDRSAVLRSVLEALEPRVDQALAGGASDLEASYRERSVLRGREVELLEGDRPLRGTVVDLSARDGLLLRLAGGQVVHVRAEHARDVRPIDG